MGKPHSKPQQAKIDAGLCIIISCPNPVQAFSGRGARPVRCAEHKHEMTARRREALEQKLCQTCKVTLALKDGECARCLRGVPISSLIRDGSLDNQKALGNYLQAIAAKPNGPQILKRAIEIEKECRRALAANRIHPENESRLIIEAVEVAELELLRPEPVVELPSVYEPYRQYPQYVAPKGVL